MGSGKTTRMFEEIRKNSGRQLVIVPEQFSYEFDKKLYFYVGAEKFNEILSLSFTGLSRQIFQMFGDPNRNGDYADDYARMILIYQAISNTQSNPDTLNYFRKQSSYNGFAEEVLDLINEMKRSGTEPDLLMKKSPLLDRRLMDKTNDIANIYLEYNRLMTEYGFKDNLENIMQSAEVANREEFFRGMNIYIDEFESFNGDQIEMLKIMIESAENVYITLRTDNVNAGSFTLFDMVNNTYRRISRICNEMNIRQEIENCGESKRFRNPELLYLSKHIMQNNSGGINPPAPDNIRIFEAKDMYSEAEYVCATIKHLICDNPEISYRDIAVMSNRIEDYADILRETFERCEIPYFLSISKPVMHSSLIVFLISVLEILSARKIKSEHIFRIMKCGILNIDVTEISLFENYCYKWNIEGDAWKEPFTAEDGNLEMLEGIRQSVINPLMNLKKKVSGKNTATAICRMLYEYLEECGAEKSISSMMGKLINLDRDYEAGELKRIWSCLMDILDSISDVLGEKVITFTEIARIIKSMTGRLEYSVTPQTLDSVTSVSALTARLAEPKVVFIMGANDGDFPVQVSRHGIFSETEKQNLSEKGIEISRSITELISAERLVVYKALSTASEKIYITYTLSDLSGKNKYPAQTVSSIINMFGNENILLTKDNITPDYYAVTYHSAFYHYMQNVNEKNKYISSIKDVLMKEPEYRKRIRYITERSEMKQNYQIDPDVIQKLKSFTPFRLSATGIEDYKKCKFMYFCKSMMKLSEREKIEIDNRISGNIMHRCLADIFRNTDKEAFISMTGEELEKLIRKYAEKYLEEKLGGDFGKNKSFYFQLRKITENLLDILKYLQEELNSTLFNPVAFEAELTKQYSLTLESEDGHEIVFGGTVDRIDTWTKDDKKYIRIIDYKSSEKKITPENLVGGINIQLLLYLFTATEENGMFSDCIPAGVLYSYIYPKDNTDGTTALRATGLVLGRREVLNAMEKGVTGKFIPVTFKKDGTPDLRKSSDILATSEGMEWIKEHLYGELKKMMQTLLDGNVEALPQCVGSNDPCQYCPYVNICDSSGLKDPENPDAELIEDIKNDNKIFGKTLEETEEE